MIRKRLMNGYGGWRAFSVLLVLAASCANNTVSLQTGYLQLFIKDSPTVFDSITVTINKGQLWSAPTGRQNSGGWKVLFDTPLECNLAQLRNGRSRLLFSGRVATGQYDSLRLDFTHCKGVILDSVVDIPFWPAGKNWATGSGLIGVTKAETTLALVDIDLYDSIVRLPDSAGYFFAPHIDFYPKDSTGDFYGTVSTAARVYLVRSDDTLSYTDTETQQNYFGFFCVPGGVYQIFFRPADTLAFDTLVLHDLTLIPPASLDLGHIELPGRN